jgi:hypothetical protein
MLTTLLRASSLAVLFAAAPAATAATLFVDANLTTGLDDGSSWANAYQGSNGLQTALAAASSGDDVFVAQGTYLPTAGGVRTISFALQTGVEVYGGFLGTEAGPGERPPFGTAPSVLTGDLNGDDGSNLFNDNSHHVVNAAGTNLTAVLDGFTVTSGNANGAGNNNRGGGILCIGSASPTVRNCIFQQHRSTFGGASGYINGAAPRFTDCTFENGIGGSFGGAFDIATAGAVRFDRCLFRGNRAARAGALEVFATAGVIVSNSIFEGNTATGGAGGGAVWIGQGGSTQFRNNTVVGNISSSSPFAGLRVEASSVSVANGIFWDNAGQGAQNSVNQISGTGATFSIVEGGLAGAGNLGSSPQFVDLAGGDFTLSDTSPAIDAGNSGQVPAGITLDHAGDPRFSDILTVPDTGSGAPPVVDIGAFESQGAPIPTFCDDTDGSLTSCPCGNPGSNGSGCDIQQGTGGVALSVVAQQITPVNRMTLLGTGFPAVSSPTSIVIRAPALDPAAPVVFGDGLRCVGVPLVRLAATFAFLGQVSHTFGHGAMAGTGDFYYQLWFRNTPAAFCTPDAFNLSNGRIINW